MLEGMKLTDSSVIGQNIYMKGRFGLKAICIKYIEIGVEKKDTKCN